MYERSEEGGRQTLIWQGYGELWGSIRTRRRVVGDGSRIVPGRLPSCWGRLQQPSRASALPACLPSSRNNSFLAVRDRDCFAEAAAAARSGQGPGLGLSAWLPAFGAGPGLSVCLHLSSICLSLQGRYALISVVKFLLPT